MCPSHSQLSAAAHPLDVQQAEMLAATVSVAAAALDSLEAAADLRAGVLSLRDSCIALLSRLCHRARADGAKDASRGGQNGASRTPALPLALTNGRANGHTDAGDEDARKLVPVVLATRCVDVLRCAGACSDAPVVTWPLQSHADFIGCASMWYMHKC
jgi:hypothetical protein